MSEVLVEIGYDDEYDDMLMWRIICNGVIMCTSDQLFETLEDARNNAKEFLEFIKNGNPVINVL